MADKLTTDKYIALELLGLFDDDIVTPSSLSTYGITLTVDSIEKGLCGVKSVINTNELLFIPIDYEYNTFKLTINGILNCDGIVNIVSNCLPIGN